jgi:predicted nucleotidyltransferase
MNPEKDLNDLVRRLKEASGANLRAVVLYGSAAATEFDREHSDLNILCLLDRLNAASLRGLRPVTLWWWRRGHPAPLLFTFGELRDSADVFSIELLDMKQHHRMLWGDDLLAQLEVPMDLHRLQVERELRTNVIRLRQAYLRSRGRDAELVELMIASASSFAALFRHSLIALGESPPDGRRAVADRLAARLGLDSAGFLAVLDLRDRKRRVDGIDVDRTFAEYLNAVMRVAEEMDRCLAAK